MKYDVPSGKHFMQIKNFDRSCLLCLFVLCSPPRPPPFSLPGDMHPIPLRILLLLLAFPSLVIAVDLMQCMIDFNLLSNATGGVDHQGRPVIANAAGITYKTCTEHCRVTSRYFIPGEFAKLFSSWLLPWFALISELPFGSGNYQDDFTSGEPSRRFVVALTTYKNEISCHECRVPCAGHILPRPHFPKHSVGLSKGETRPAQGQDSSGAGVDIPSANPSRSDKR